MTSIVTRLREDHEMLCDGYQQNLTKTWHDEVMSQAAINALEAADLIESLTSANSALMAERSSLIATKHDQIKTLTAERDAALAQAKSHLAK